MDFLFLDVNNDNANINFPDFSQISRLPFPCVYIFRCNISLMPLTTNIRYIFFDWSQYYIDLGP